MTTILAVSGSLRAASSNTNLLRAAALLAAPDVTVLQYEGLGTLPPFNPDLDDEGSMPLPPVGAWRSLLRSADAVLISTPEYAHGVPGVLKNALDWVVGTGEFVGKPVGLVNASPRSTHGQASLIETLTVMMAVLKPEALVGVPLSSKRLTPDEMAALPLIAGSLRAALAALVTAAHASRTTPI